MRKALPEQLHQNAGMGVPEKQAGTNQYRRAPAAWEDAYAWWAAPLRVAACLVLAGCVAACAWGTRRWPLVNDAALMQYVVFLMHSGLAPYRQIGDYNLPGSYVPGWAAAWMAGALHVSLAAVWRVMDLACTLGCGAAMVAIAGRARWFAGVWAGALFLLYHARDGVGQAGQRDLWMTLLLLWAVALGLWAMRSEPHRTGAVAGFGLCVGAAAAVKPLALLWLVCAAPLLLRRGAWLWRVAAACVAGCAVPVGAAWWFLAAHHTVAAFVQTMRLDLPYHASLGRGSFWSLLGTSTISSVLKLLVLGVAAWAAARGAGPRLKLTVVGAVLGLVSFLAQGKGYPYQRYPYVAFLLVAVALAFARAVRARGGLARTLGVAGFAFGVLFCAPTYLRGALDAHWPVDVQYAMEKAITAAAGPGGVRALDGRVQCLDMVSGCVPSLLELGLRSSTGLLYDELVFPQRPNGWRGPEAAVTTGSLPTAVAWNRTRFEAAIQSAPPRVIVLSAWLFPSGPGQYQELEAWPWLRSLLATRYRLAAQRSFPLSENGPMGFRMYVLRGGLH